MNTTMTNAAKSLLRPRTMKATVPMLTSSALPTLPGYVFRLNRCLQTSDPDMEAATRVIRTDASLTAQVLRLANLYRQESRAEIGSVREAIEEIGVARLRTLVMTCPLLDCAGNSGEWSQIQSFWQHSYMTAVLSEAIAEVVGYADAELAYTAGLLHNIGELSLIMQAQQTGAAWPLDGESTVARRRRSSEVGRRLAIACHLPPELVEVCSSSSEQNTAWHDMTLVSIVQAADRFCQSCGLAPAEPPKQLTAERRPPASRSIFSKLPGCTAETAAKLDSELAQRFREAQPGLEFNVGGMLKAGIEPAAMAPPQELLGMGGFSERASY